MRIPSKNRTKLAFYRHDCKFVIAKLALSKLFVGQDGWLASFRSAHELNRHKLLSNDFYELSQIPYLLESVSDTYL
jgi:hypothetical protein